MLLSIHHAFVHDLQEDELYADDAQQHDNGHFFEHVRRPLFASVSRRFSINRDDMNEPNWFEIGLAAVIAAFGWLLKRHVARVDGIAANYVTREQLDTTIAHLREERREMRDDRARMHEENTEALQYIRERVDKLVDRQ